MNFKNVAPFAGELINVIIETPRGTQNKYAFDAHLELFQLKKVLPMGTVFPFDFGFIPNTRSEDGDPLDVMVIMDQPAFAGCLVVCRPIGIPEAWQKEPKKAKERTDRIIAVADRSILYADINDVKDLNKNMAAELQNFFIDYNKHGGKVFTPIRWASAKTTMNKIQKHLLPLPQ
jgi:inorganic pyrophosphatase